MFHCPTSLGTDLLHSSSSLCKALGSRPRGPTHFDGRKWANTSPSRLTCLAHLPLEPVGMLIGGPYLAFAKHSAWYSRFTLLRHSTREPIMWHPQNSLEALGLVVVNTMPSEHSTWQTLVQCHWVLSSASSGFGPNLCSHFDRDKLPPLNSRSQVSLGVSAPFGNL